MRAHLWLAGLVVGLGLAAPASAQRAYTFFGNAAPLQFQVVNTEQADMPIARPQNFSNRTGFSLLDYMPTFRGISNRRVIGQSQFPTPKQMPGQDYLKAFKYGRGVNISP